MKIRQKKNMIGGKVFSNASKIFSKKKSSLEHLKIFFKFL